MDPSEEICSLISARGHFYIKEEEEEEQFLRVSFLIRINVKMDDDYCLANVTIKKHLFK